MSRRSAAASGAFGRTDGRCRGRAPCRLRGIGRAARVTVSARHHAATGSMVPVATVRPPCRRLVGLGDAASPRAAPGPARPRRSARRSSRMAPALAVPVGDVRREQLRDDRLQARGTSAVEGDRGLARADPLLQPARVRGAEGLNAADHLVEQHADRPELGLRVDLPRLEALRREVRDAAEVVARDLSAERQRLGDAEVEHLDLVSVENTNVPGLEIAVQETVNVRPSSVRSKASAA